MAGQATRLSPLPASKELYPVGFQVIEGVGIRPKVACQHLLEKMELAGVRKVFLMLRSGKWDIPAYLGDGSQLNLDLGYLVVRCLDSVAHTLDQAYPFVKHARIATGFPDILFQPDDAFKHLLDRQLETGADIVLGAVPFDYPHKGGMIELDASGRVWQVVEKPQQSQLRHSWFIAVWAPSFTEFLHQYLIQRKARIAEGFAPSQELPLGDVIQTAIAANLRVEAVVFPEGSYLDIGTPADLVKAVQQQSTLTLESIHSF